MKLSDLLHRKQPPAGPQNPTAPALAEPPPLPDQPAAAPAETAAPLTVEQAVRMFNAIREMLGEDKEVVFQVPCRAVLAGLPEPLRGPLWRADEFPDMQLEIPKEAVLEQLGHGRVALPLADILPMLPHGWAKNMPNATVDLDLASVVQAIPPDLLLIPEPVSRPADDVKHMPDYFKPAAAQAVAPDAVTAAAPAAAPASPPVAAPAAEPAAVMAAAASPPAAPPAAARPLRPGEWNGVEPARDAGARTLDLNRAGIEELRRLSGIGAKRAEAIFRYRQERSPFTSVFDLAEVPGVGRKTFRQVTGLTFRRRDRHEVLNGLLGLDKAARPALPDLLEQIRARLAAAGAVLGGDEGMPLAACGTTPEQGAQYAALVPQLFRKAGRYLKPLNPGAAPAWLALPAADPPLVLIRADAFCLILVLTRENPLEAVVQQGQPIVRELDWLLQCRAVVHAA